MTTYSVVYIPSEKYHQPTQGNSLSELITVSNIEEAEKLLAAEFYTSYAKKCERNIKTPKIHPLFKSNIKTNSTR